MTTENQEEYRAFRNEKVPEKSTKKKEQKDF